ESSAKKAQVYSWGEYGLDRPTLGAILATGSLPSAFHIEVVAHVLARFLQIVTLNEVRPGLPECRQDAGIFYEGHYGDFLLFVKLFDQANQCVGVFAVGLDIGGEGAIDFYDASGH